MAKRPRGVYRLGVSIAKVRSLRRFMRVPRTGDFMSKTAAIDRMLSVPWYAYNHVSVSW